MVVTPLLVCVFVHEIVMLIGADSRDALASQVFENVTALLSEPLGMLQATDDPVTAVITLPNSCGAISATGMDTRFSPTFEDDRSSAHRFACKDEPLLPCD